MTTLTESLDKQLESNAYFDYTTLTKEQVIKIVIEWLQQEKEDNPRRFETRQTKNNFIEMFLDLI